MDNVRVTYDNATDAGIILEVITERLDSIEDVIAGLERSMTTKSTLDTLQLKLDVLEARLNSLMRELQSIDVDERLLKEFNYIYQQWETLRSRLMQINMKLPVELELESRV